MHGHRKGKCTPCRHGNTGPVELSEVVYDVNMVEDLLSEVLYEVNLVEDLALSVYDL